MRNLLPQLVGLMILATLFVPGLVAGQVNEPLVGSEDCQQGRPGEDGEFSTGDCDFQDFISLIQKVMDFIILLSLPATAIVTAYAGFQMISAGDNAGKRSEAKGMLGKVLIGFIFILSAWLIVKAITSPLLKEGYVTI